jgi:hypothetical protein
LQKGNGGSKPYLNYISSADIYNQLPIRKNNV